MSETKIQRKSERRFTDRFKIPDGLVYFRQLKKINWINYFQGPCALNDIASNSASFEYPHDIEIKQQVEVKIISSGYQGEFQVKGKITRKNAKSKDSLFIYVVQFSPFGKGYHYNSYQNRDKLRVFIKFVKEKNKE